MKKTGNRYGFTLVEILLYLGLIVLFGTALVAFSMNLTDLRERNELDQSLALEARIVSQRIGWIIRDSEGVISADSNRLELDQPDSSDVTSIFLSDGRIFIDNAGEVSALTGSDVRALGLQFEEWHAADVPAQVVYYTIDLESDQASGGASGLQARMSIRGAALLRNNLE